MGYPNFAGKHAHDAVFTPQESVAPRLARGAVAPESIVVFYQSRVAELLDAGGARRLDDFPADWRGLRLVERPGRRPVGAVGEFGIGAPAAVVVLEELIALGARRIVNVGTAGGLQPDLDFGEIVVCDRALRDEGVSHHYVDSARFAEPDPGLTATLADALSARGVPHRTGATWTVDAPFRETVAEARAYREEGIVTVEMEASALFAVGRLRGVAVASAFVVSDHVFPDSEWAHDFTGAPVRDGTAALLETVLDVLGTPAEP